jgi:hypothetical protein
MAHASIPITNLLLNASAEFVKERMPNFENKLVPRLQCLLGVIEMIAVARDDWPLVHVYS